ncbi:glycosyl hydrolase [Lasius niger]|uniref:Glycosyl hydrolase n=1 Tax=Lasius niger TaxID=67767 RepID=A0A0J7K395_LASNI|nr:glycosyl hydrolase [Lasius niger]
MCRARTEIQIRTTGKESRSATANDAVKLPAVDIGERDRKNESPVSLTEKTEGQVRTGNTSDSPAASTSGIQDIGRAKPKRYRSVSREIGKGPEGEVLFRSVLEALGDSEDSGDEVSRAIGTLTAQKCR